MFEIYDGRLELYQWDIDRKLIVKDENITQVHFCNHSDDCSLVCEIYNENGVYLVDIPNVILQDAWAIRVYGYDKNYTKHEKVFRVKARTKPADYVYTETEILRYEDLRDKVEEIEKNGVSEERVATAVSDYLNENPVEVDLSAYATTEYVDKALENIEISGGDIDLTGYATEDYVDTGLAAKADKEHTHDEYLTEHQDLSDYALKSEIPSTDGLATKDYVDDAVANVDIDTSDFITEIPAEYITENELTAKGYATRLYVDDCLANFEGGGGLSEEEVNNLIDLALSEIGVAEESEY